MFGLIVLLVATSFLFALSWFYVGLLSASFPTQAAGVITFLTETLSVPKANIPIFNVMLYSLFAFMVSSTFYKVVQTLVYGRYNNNLPRGDYSSKSSKSAAQAENRPAKQNTLERRARDAHYNLVENFAVFAAAVIVAHVAKVPIDTQIKFSLMFVVFKKIYWVCYLANISTLRSFLHLASVWCCLGLFICAIYPTASYDKKWTETAQSMFLSFKSFDFPAVSRTFLKHVEL